LKEDADSGGALLIELGARLGIGERGKESGNGAGKLSGGNIRKSLDLLAGFNPTIPPKNLPPHGS
jgi:hypothetical protein